MVSIIKNMKWIDPHKVNALSRKETSDTKVQYVNKRNETLTSSSLCVWFFFIIFLCSYIHYVHTRNLRCESQEYDVSHRQSQ